MVRTQSYGKLFHHANEYACSNKWMKGLIQRISSLSCEFDLESKDLSKRINVSHRKGITDDKENLGKGVAQFLVCSYMIKNMIKVSYKSGELITYHPPVNLILDSVNVDYTSIVNKEVIESIQVILNHPHFEGCNSIEDIQKKIPSVEKLEYISVCSEENESDDEDEEVILEKNIFID
tara:strand:+ start:910 stop:1443 length:534 start_codon:yes stop_codon:yes gene_type:complete